MVQKITRTVITMAGTKKRKLYQPEFKARVALEAVRGKLTINQIAKQFEVLPNQISKWKKQFLESLPRIFADLSKTTAPHDSERVARQCELLVLNRSSLYYRERPARVEDAEIMRRLDAQYTETPLYGYRHMTADRISRSGTKRRSRFIETGLKTKQQRSRKG